LQWLRIQTKLLQDRVNRVREPSRPTKGNMAAGVFVSEREREKQVLRRISRRFLWFLFILLVINFLDRSNIGFAALTMNRDLGLFGIAVPVFSVRYMLFEIPSPAIRAALVTVVFRPTLRPANRQPRPRTT
jgi:hypothetical protein